MKEGKNAVIMRSSSTMTTRLRLALPLARSARAMVPSQRHQRLRISL